MIHIVFPRESKDSNDGFNEFGMESIKRFNFERYELFNPEDGLPHSIFDKLNAFRDMIIQQNLDDNDIVIFSHADVKILDPFIETKLNSLFSKKPNIGLVGVIGSKIITSNGGWWLSDYSNHLGRVIQGYNDNTYKELSRGIGYSEDIVTVDGCFFCVRMKTLKQIKFRDDVYQDTYHFYDMSYCIDVIENGWDICVADILVQHKSEGPLSEKWHITKQTFIKNVIERGYEFPIDKKQIVGKRK